VEVDLLVLGTGFVPSKGIEEISYLLKLPKAADKFLMEAHPKLGPVDTTTDGVFLAGVASGPKDICISVAQGSAAASRATRLLKSGKAPIMGITASVDPDKCVGCGACVDKCPYGALSLEEGKLKIIAALCKGCGTCPTACPTGALEQRHFRNEQIVAQVKSVFDYGGVAV
jgi:heterodisulfide reductase subunit A